MTIRTATARRAAKKPPPAVVRRTAEKPATAAPDELALTAAHNTLAANPLVGVRRKEIVAAASTLLGQLARQPRAVSRQYAKFLAELVRVAGGRSSLAPAGGDRRFADAAWNDSAAFRRLLQAYLALGKSLDACVDEAKLDAANTDRARFVVSLLVDALAPTNFIVTNPAALKKARDTRGVSVIRGLANLVEDLTGGSLLPKQVDPRPFKVGKNLATSPGAVVFRNELIELIQYTPATPEVHARPLVIVPPQINKFYVFDLAPAKSIVAWSLASGVTTFAVSWRNPTREHADWGLDAYVGALDEALDAAREITGSADVNVWGACSGGITLTAYLGWLAARRARKVHAATLAVCVLDMSTIDRTTPGLFVTPTTIAAARAASRKRGVVEGRDLARMFAWMRPNDLVWNYVVNNYLLGNDPPAHEILFWNNDTTRLPARLHGDFLDLVDANPFAAKGKLAVRGRRIDVGAIGIDSYVVGGLADHITPWQGVYQTARLYGSRRATFVLSNGGHIQSLLNPPGGGRSWFMAGRAGATTPEAWMKRQAKTEGSWWPHWREWIKARSGPRAAAPAALGSAKHAPLGAAPGTYLFEK
jgi:polyhydroxyalkanoate synthase